MYLSIFLHPCHNLLTSMGNSTFHFIPSVHAFILIMKQLVLLLFLLQIGQFFLECLFQGPDDLFVLFLNFGDFNFSLVKDLVFYFHSVAFHCYLKP